MKTASLLLWQKLWLAACSRVLRGAQCLVPVLSGVFRLGSAFSHVLSPPSLGMHLLAFINLFMMPEIIMNKVLKVAKSYWKSETNVLSKIKVVLDALWSVPPVKSKLQGLSFNLFPQQSISMNKRQLQFTFENYKLATSVFQIKRSPSLKASRHLVVNQHLFLHCCSHFGLRHESPTALKILSKCLFKRVISMAAVCKTPSQEPQSSPINLPDLILLHRAVCLF